jgi:nitrate/nitrite transporter NarK
MVTIFYLTDWPRQAKWLAADEREWITSELEREKQLKLKKHSYRILEAFKHREVILLTGAYFLLNCSGYGFHFWLPVMLKKLSGSSNMIVGLITIIPYCFGMISMLLVGWSSDRTGERRWHTAVSMIAFGIGFLLSAVLQKNVALTVSMFCLAAVGQFGCLPGFWSLPTSFLTGTMAAATIGLINSVGNLGGFVGPFVVGWLNTAAGSFLGGILYLSFTALVGAGLILALRPVKQKVEATAGISS